MGKDKFDKYGYELRQLEDYNEIVNQKQRNTPYLYYENQEGEMFIADAPVVESQFIRKLIAKDIDALDRALWNENIRKDWMIEIVKTLRPHFENLIGNIEIKKTMEKRCKGYYDLIKKTNSSMSIFCRFNRK